jgi:hypothetical protein
MPVALILTVLASALLLPAAAQAQTTSTSATDYLVDKEHPRLLLPARRLRLLQRERDRQTARWVQFQTYMAGGADMPEKGFAYALYSAIGGSQQQGRDAISWALSAEATDLRQLALVYDWCHALLSPAQRTRLETKLKTAMEKTAQSKDVSTVRSRLMAAIALSGHVRPFAEQTIQSIADGWWKAEILSKIAEHKVPFELQEHYALFELLHVLRDSLDIDLRESSAKFFTSLPIFHLLSHYPAPFPAPENEYRIPLMASHDQPDLREAVRSRAAALAMIAYDTNAQETQFLQGWVMHDSYLLRSPFGITYEFLWANPYQPGLSYHYLPNIFYDPPTGRLIIRSSWEDSALWLYLTPGKMQMFKEGQVVNLQQQALAEPIVIGNTVVLPANLSARFSVSTEEPSHYYVIGLKPKTTYELEVDDEEMTEYESDIGGVLELKFPAKRRAAALMRERPS